MSRKLVETILLKSGFSPNRRRVFANLYWAVLGKCVTILSELLVGVLIARTLGPEQFGLMSYVISFVILFSVFANFGLDGIEIRELSRPGAERGKLLGTAMALRTGFSLLTILLIFLTLKQFEPDRYTTLLVMIYACSLLASPFAVIRNYFTSIIQHEYVVKSEMFRTVIGACLKLAVIRFSPQLTFLLAAFAFDFFLVGIGYIFSYRHHAEPEIGRWGVELKLGRALLRSSVPLLLSAAAIVFYQKINAIMIRHMLDDVAVGYFSVAAKLTEFSIFVPLILAQSITPLLVKAHTEDPIVYVRKRQECMDWMVWTGFALSLFMSVTAYPVIKLLYGSAYLPAIPVLQIMAWKTVFVSLTHASGQIMIIENIHQFAVYRNLLGCLISVIGNWLFIPIYGAVGSGAVVVLTFFVAGFLAHSLIPVYQTIFKIQKKSITSGLFRIFNTKVRRSPP